MSQPITVYPTETPGLFLTEDGRKVRRIWAIPGSAWWCCNCTQLLSTGEAPHYEIEGHFYCHRCIRVPDLSY